MVKQRPYPGQRSQRWCSGGSADGWQTGYPCSGSAVLVSRTEAEQPMRIVGMLVRLRRS